jgi:hypothetical protein
MECRIMKLFIRKHETSVEVPESSFWPQDRLDEIDDDEFARAIAAGRVVEAERSGELVGA